MTRDNRKRTAVVGVGASAGGLQALEAFFRGVPADPGFAVVVVTHLGPDRESHLSEILARYTSLQVVAIRHGAVLKPNCVYVLSAGALLGVANGRLTLKDARPPARRERKPIDVLLSELAKDQGEYAAGVILSGADGDGTLGVKAIKEHGGLTMAQVGNGGGGPSHPDMPESAISTGLVDFAIPAEEMGAKLVAFAKSLDAPEVVDTQDPAQSRAEIYEILRNQVGHDFSGYKTKTFVRRVQRRMQVQQSGEIDAYLELLRRDPREVNALFRDLLINVTNFFRDREAFDKLKDLVIPKLFEDRGADDVVRVWIPGCATGEEVFSVAMLMREHMDTLKRGLPRVQIFATDIDEHALNVARAARYPEALLESVSPERLQRFFVKDGGSYVLTKDVRDLCIFSPHSVIRDPPFSRIDLISCRNLLIYFGVDVQSQVVPTFHYALRTGGYLFLGTSENVSQFTDMFTPLEKKNRIFRAKKDPLGAARLPAALVSLRASIATRPLRTSHTRGLALRQTVESQVIERFAPAHVVADRDGEIVYYSARTGRYLEASAGAPSRQLFALARKGLRLDLRTVFREAVETGKPAVRERVSVDAGDGRVQFVTVHVEQMDDIGGDDPLYIVLFSDEGPSLAREEAAGAGIRDDASVTQLEHELRETRERLQSVVEEYETALEELKSSNEELVSLNEEMQSTNEELEASKEESQSVNEELHTVNLELQSKVESLDAANDDLHNLFENTQVAMIFLTSDLMIRTFTPAMTQIFNLLPSDRGRPLTDLSSRFALPSLAADLKAASETGASAERRPEQPDGFLVRVAPYLNGDGRIDGAVVTFVDVSTLIGARRGPQAHGDTDDR